MNCYKLNYSVSKKRINDLIHKGLEYEKEHNIKQSEKETIRALKDRRIEVLERALERACKYCSYGIGDYPEPNYFITQAEEEVNDEITK